MDARERASIARTLRRRRRAIAARWHDAIAPTGFPPVAPLEVRRELERLTAEAAAVLLAEPFDPAPARSVGAALVVLRYLAPEALSATQRVLARELVDNLPAAQLAALLPRLAGLLAELAAGFVAVAQGALLAEQEAARAVPLAARRRAEAALQEVQQELRVCEVQRAWHQAARRRAQADLTAQEDCVLDLLAAGGTNPEIAAELHIQPKTVGTHIHNIGAKLGLRKGLGGRQAVLAAARERGILPPPGAAGPEPPPVDDPSVEPDEKSPPG